jgi:quercetin dioxygenase-like cupin family protein
MTLRFLRWRLSSATRDRHAGQGGKEVTLTPGQTFYESPTDVHTVGRNASTTKPAKFLVVLLKRKGVDVVLPAE